MLREPNEEKAPKTTGPKRPAACFGSHLYQKNDLLKAVLRVLTRKTTADSLFHYLAVKIVAAHRATARLRQPAPPSTKHQTHPAPLSAVADGATLYLRRTRTISRCAEISPR